MPVAAPLPGQNVGVAVMVLVGSRGIGDDLAGMQEHIGGPGVGEAFRNIHRPGQGRVREGSHLREADGPGKGFGGHVRMRKARGERNRYRPRHINGPAVVLVAPVFGIQKGEQEILGRDRRRDRAASTARSQSPIGSSLRATGTIRYEPTATPATAAVTASAQAGTGTGSCMAFQDPFCGSRPAGSVVRGLALRGLVHRALRVSGRSAQDGRRC